MLWNPTIFNIIRWLAGSMGEMTHRPSIWCSKHYFFFVISYRLRALKTLYFHFCKFIKKQDSKRIQNRSINSFLRHLRVKQVTCFCFLFNFCLLHHHVSILNKSEHVCRIVSNHIRVFRTLKQVWTCLKNPIKSHRSWWISQCYAIRMLLERVKTCL